MNDHTVTINGVELLVTQPESGDMGLPTAVAVTGISNSWVSVLVGVNTLDATGRIHRLAEIFDAGSHLGAGRLVQVGNLGSAVRLRLKYAHILTLSTPVTVMVLGIDKRGNVHPLRNLRGDETVSLTPSSTLFTGGATGTRWTCPSDADTFMTDGCEYAAVGVVTAAVASAGDAAVTEIEAKVISGPAQPITEVIVDVEGDLEIGAVEIKNATDDTRATVGADGLAVYSTMNRPTKALVTDSAAVTTPGTAVPLADAPTLVRSCVIQARKATGANTGNVCFGDSGVLLATNPGTMLTPGLGYELVPPGCVIDLAAVFVDAANANDGVTYNYIPA
jgi:hypothetical protein